VNNETVILFAFIVEHIDLYLIVTKYL